MAGNGSESFLTVDQMLLEARAELSRVSAGEARAAQEAGAVLVDIRSEAQRSRDGEIPGAKRYPRNVLEWRLDPSSAHRDAEIARRDVRLVLLCDEGFQSSLAAASARRFGLDATDVIGGFQAWRAEGLPVEGAVAKPASAVPGARSPRLLQSWLGVVHPLGARLAARRRYGPVFRSNDAIVGELFHVADRELIEEMFKWKPVQYGVSEPRQVMEPVTGPSSILLLDGDRHLRLRKLMLPPFHGQAIARYAELIADISNRELDGWRVGETVQTRAVAQAITLEVIIQAVFGITDPQRIAELRRVLPRLSAPNPLLVLVQKDLGPRSPWGRFLRVRDHVDALLYEEIGRRRSAADSEERGDILALLLSSRDEDGNPLTDRELRDQLITLLLAGHETTATSIGWAFERLLRAPAALERLTAEVEAGDGDDYLEAVIKETMRVRPVVPEVFRAPTERTELGGYVFEPGTQLAASIVLVQHDPELYPPDPEAFRPERFLEGAPEPYTWVPFGGGVRRCLGAAFAQLEMKVVISTILSRARLRAPRAREEKVRFRGVTLLPSRGGEAVVESVDGPRKTKATTGIEPV